MRSGELGEGRRRRVFRQLCCADNGRGANARGASGWRISLSRPTAAGLSRSSMSTSRRGGILVAIATGVVLAIFTAANRAAGLLLPAIQRRPRSAPDASGICSRTASSTSTSSTTPSAASRTAARTRPRGCLAAARSTPRHRPTGGAHPSPPPRVRYSHSSTIVARRQPEAAPRTARLETPRGGGDLSPKPVLGRRRLLGAGEYQGSPLLLALGNHDAGFPARSSSAVWERD